MKFAGICSKVFQDVRSVRSNHITAKFMALRCAVLCDIKDAAATYFFLMQIDLM